MFKIILAGLLSFAPYVQAEEDITGRYLPRIEAGAAFLNFYLPDYPGADESRYRVLPVPYFIYRGEIFRADREGGYRGRFFNFEKFEFDVSASASFPTESEDNKAREGMTDLDWLGEVGPRFKYHLHKGPMVKIDFELPFRYVFSTDFNHFDSRGYTVSPEIDLQHRALFDIKGFFNFSFMGMWATEPLMDYFYEVEPGEVLNGRNQYDGKTGFLGLNTRISYVRPLNEKWVLFVGVSRSWYAQAKNRASPLLRDIETESYFLGLAWNIYQSKEAGAR